MVRCAIFVMMSLFLVFPGGQSIADDWSHFRGIAGIGNSTETGLPIEWGKQENILWKVKLPRPGNGSPIVVADRVYVTSAEDADGKLRSLYCFDGKTGEEIFVKTVDFEKKMPTHKTNPYCGTTPASDGKVVVVWHGSAGLYCYDMDGKELWSRQLGPFKHIWGYATSPVIHQNKVILHTGPGKETYVAAFDIKSGETIWKTNEPVEGTGDRNDANQYQGSWSTPIITRRDGKDQIVCMMTTRVNGYDPESGEVIWSCRGLRHKKGDLAYSSPVIADNLCFVTGGFGGPAMAFPLGGMGDITSRRLWRKEKQPQSIGSGVYVDGVVYRPNAGPGSIQCIDPKTGETLWMERVTSKAHWASLLLAGGNIYATDQDGTTTLFKPNREKFEEVASNRLEDPCNATPAISNGKIFIRGFRNLYCIGK